MSRADRFLNACRGEPVDCTPVWLMRQAGRYQPSYRNIRKDHDFFALCRNAELSAQVTLNAVKEMGVDAAIIFSDILLPLIPMGAPVELTEKGPKLSQPIRTEADIDKLHLIDPEQELDMVMQAIKLTVDGLDGCVPLIGFVGAPITLASYLIEGGHSKNFENLKAMFFNQPKAAHRLLDKLATVVARHLRAQANAGCQALQVFDSWAGIFGPDDYAEFGAPYIKRIFEEIKECGVPRIFFGTNTTTLLPQIKDCDPDVIGIDWRVPLSQARLQLGAEIPLQGNLDPCCLFMSEADLEARIKTVLDEAAGGPHIFNLGHGVLPPTNPDRVRFLVETVHRVSQCAS